MELMTKHREMMLARHKRIIKRYNSLREQHPEAARSAVAERVADKECMTLQGIVKILKAYGVEKPWGFDPFGQAGFDPLWLQLD